MKIIKWIYNNILFFLTLFLLAFIPLYPKLPILDIKNTWVYIRLEDFVVVLVLSIWAILLLRRKITLKTPITLPILIFWIIGGLATIHGVLLIFPSVANVFPNIAFLSFLRRIEYLSLFFVAFAAIKDRKDLKYVIFVLVATLFLVSFYGLGQKYLEFPAYLTMNEEFAKGIPIRLSELSRVPSTFGGHYDLAAYLVLIVPILTSLVFGVKNVALRIIFIAGVSLGTILIFMTVSRVSFFVLVASLILLLFFYKKKFVLISVPIIFLIASIFFLQLTPALLSRFGNTVKETDVLVDAKTGEAIGHVRKIDFGSFEGKIVNQRFYKGRDDLNAVIKGYEDKEATISALVDPQDIPSQSVVLLPPDVPTGENLPQGTGYINLSLSPVKQKLNEFFYEKEENPYMFVGNFLVKRASAYDLSFTTRFQGEWPNALAAFKRNVFFGSGYSSVSLAVDNNYLRILGEVGLLGFASFFAIFAIGGIYIKKLLPEVDSPIVRSFTLGFVAGVFGLVLNAILIDVFEASKIAFLLWLIAGVTLGTLHLYQKGNISLFSEFKKVITSSGAVILYLLIVVLLLFSPMIGNYFVGDDFTWFRWVADCDTKCILGYFTQSDGFFYRPGAKLYFLLMYNVFWLNQIVYHIVSLALHFTVAVLVFLIAKKVLQNYLLASLSGFTFLILSGYHESIFWISATGFLWTTVFTLLSLLLFIKWEETKSRILFFGSLICIILSPLFHELGVVTPLILVLYKLINQGKFNLKNIFKAPYLLLFAPLIPYLILRFLAQSHWFSGDYSYNLLKLPYNTIGNTIGYLMLSSFGSVSGPIYQAMRDLTRENILLALFATLILILISTLLYKIIWTKTEKEERKILLFGILFFTVALLPFLGLGNIASRYSYLASFGFVILFVFSINKLYGYLKSQGRDIALACTGVITAVFLLLHIIQIQQIHGDWHDAGKKTQEFFVSIDELYKDYWAKEEMKFYFVNTPIRNGEAWVFPVGLPDALWLVSRNPNIGVYNTNSVEEALNMVDGSRNQVVLVFNKFGKVTEEIKKLPAE